MAAPPARAKGKERNGDAPSDDYSDSGSEDDMLDASVDAEVRIFSDWREAVTEPLRGIRSMKIMTVMIAQLTKRRSTSLSLTVCIGFCL